MKTTIPTPETKANAPTRTVMDALIADPMDGAASFVFSYPYHSIRGRVSPVVTGLIQLWTGRGYIVKTCTSVKRLIHSSVRPGEVWIIWHKGATLQVFGRRPVNTPQS